MYKTVYYNKCTLACAIYYENSKYRYPHRHANYNIKTALTSFTSVVTTATNKWIRPLGTRACGDIRDLIKSCFVNAVFVRSRLLWQAVLHAALQRGCIIAVHTVLRAYVAWPPCARHCACVASIVQVTSARQLKHLYRHVYTTPLSARYWARRITLGSSYSVAHTR